MKNRSDISINLILLFVSLSIVLVGLEIAIRLIKPQLTYSTLLLLTGEQYVPGDIIPFSLKANYRSFQPSQEFRGKLVKIKTNSLGLRGRETTYDKPAGVKRILVLGDSYTFGVYVEAEENYPSRLEEILRQRGKKVEVINAGYADGWSPDEHYVWLTKKGIKFKPDLVIYGFFIGNDLTDINTDHWVDIDHNGLPAKIDNPGIYIDKDGRIRSKVKNAKAIEVGSIYNIPVLRESHLFVLLAKKIDYLRNLYYNHGLNISWGEDPLPFILKEKNDEKMNGQEKSFLDLVKGMAGVARQNNAKFLILEIPINFQVDSAFTKAVLGKEFPIKRDYFAEINPRLDKLGIRYLDLLDRMKASGGRYYPKNGEVHFNPQGHLFAAEQLADYLDKEGL